MITICDTGLLVAYLNRNDPYHSWAVTLMKQARSPMLTTEPVLTEVVVEDDYGMPASRWQQQIVRVSTAIGFILILLVLVSALASRN